LLNLSSHSCTNIAHSLSHCEVILTGKTSGSRHYIQATKNKLFDGYEAQVNC
jgi:hypothetical protein